MTTELATRATGDIMERVLLAGDLARLQPNERVVYYNKVCESVGLNPLTRPFEYINLNGKLTLYANRSASEQLRKINGVSIEKLERETTEGVYVVTSYARDKTGRTDSSIGAVPIASLKGEALANAMMKAETKSKRRVTLSICGLGWLDETEVDSIPGAQRMDAATLEAEPKPAPVQIAPPVAPAPVAPKPAEPKKAAKPPVKLVDAPKPPLELTQQEEAPWPDDVKPREMEVVKEVTQPPPPEDVQLPPVDQTEVKGSTPITRETQQRIYKSVGELNRKRGAGVAQKAMLSIHPDGRPLNKLTNEEGQHLAGVFEKMTTDDLFFQDQASK